MGWGMALALLVSVVIFYFLFSALRRLLPLVLHGLLGMAVFWLCNMYGVLKVPMDVVTFLIAAFGGVLGVAVVLVLSWLGVPL